MDTMDSEHTRPPLLGHNGSSDSSVVTLSSIQSSSADTDDTRDDLDDDRDIKAALSVIHGHENQYTSHTQARSVPASRSSSFDPAASNINHEHSLIPRSGLPRAFSDEAAIPKTSDNPSDISKSLSALQTAFNTMSVSPGTQADPSSGSPSDGSGSSYNPWRSGDEASPLDLKPGHPYGLSQRRPARSMSSTSSRSAVFTRPSSTSTTSTFASDYLQSTSCRPWVRDSDCSSISSIGGMSGNASEAGDPVDHEVFKSMEAVEFLDPRPEPLGAKLAIERDDPSQIVIRVTLPGFSLDDITVAMRRGHKVHIVADKYGEEGGHFEKLISLGSDISSAAPRAEFNGTTLSVFIARKVAGRPEASPALGSDSSPFFSSESSTEEGEAPVVTCSFGPSPLVSPSKKKRITGPEGAKAAAKAAKEEMVRRAKEQAKMLPKLGKRVLVGPHGSPSGSAGQADGSMDVTPKPASPASESTSFESFLAHPSRPKLRESNLTLRPESGSFNDAATQQHKQTDPSPTASLVSLALNGGGSDESVTTPKVERQSMDFDAPSTMSSTMSQSASLPSAQ